MSNAGTNIVSKKFQKFFRCLIIHQGISSSYSHWSYGQVNACIKFRKCTMKECFDTNYYIYLALLQICSTCTGPELLNPSTLMFNRPIRGLMPKQSRSLILFDHDHDHYSALIESLIRKMMLTQVNYYLPT